MPGGQTWGKGSATRWLCALLCSSLGLGIVSILFTNAGLTGLKAQGEGSCEKRDHKTYSGLGKWDDGPSHQLLNWHVCETENATGDFLQSADLHNWNKLDDSWYKVGCGWKNYAQASRSCASENFVGYHRLAGPPYKVVPHLVTIDSQKENDFVQKLVGYETSFIGLSERPGTEEWLWADGRNIGRAGEQHRFYTNWNRGEPNNHNGRYDESIAFMNYWTRLDMPNPSMSADACKAGPRQEPIGSGTWNDITMDTRIEYTVCEETNRSECDAANEWMHHFDSKSDTHGNCYKLVCGSYNFYEASRACLNLGARLVTIGSSDENVFVQNICGLRTCRIGLRSWGILWHEGKRGSEDWSWEDGTDLGQKYEWTGYVNWADGEPNNWGERYGSAVVMNTQDISRSMKKAFLYQRIMPVFWAWTFITLGLPLLLLVATACSSRLNSSCCAQALCIVTGVSSVGLGIQIALLIFGVSNVNDMWPGGSATLLTFLCVVAFTQIVICCAATAKAQELQWSTTVNFHSMGVREVSDFADPLQGQQESMPGSGSGISLQIHQSGSQQA